MFAFFHPEKGAPFSPLNPIYLPKGGLRHPRESAPRGKNPPPSARIRSQRKKSAAIRENPHPKSVLASNTRRILEAKKLRFLAPTS